MNNKRKTAAVVFATALIVALISVIIKHSASAAERPGPDEPCVPKDAWTETIEHPAVTHEETVVVQEAVDEVWANFQPNNHRETFEGPPSYPSDPRGSWNVHNQIPGGHEGPNGVYSKGNPEKGGNWFYRQTGVPEVTETVVVVDEEAWTEMIEHPAVKCPTEEPTEPTEGPTEPTEPPNECDPVVVESGASYYPCDPVYTPPTNEPVDNPGPEGEVGDAISAKFMCIDYDEVKIEHYINGQLDRVTFRPARKADNCGAGKDRTSPLPAELSGRYSSEEGM